MKCPRGCGMEWSFLRRHPGLKERRTRGIPPGWMWSGLEPQGTGPPGGEARLGAEGKEAIREGDPQECTQSEGPRDPTISTAVYQIE